MVPPNILVSGSYSVKINATAIDFVMFVTYSKNENMCVTSIVKTNNMTTSSAAAFILNHIVGYSIIFKLVILF